MYRTDLPDKWSEPYPAPPPATATAGGAPTGRGGREAPRRLRGRCAEYGLLTGIADEAAAGRGRCALLEGGAGSGKTALIAAVMAAARERGLRVGRVTADHPGDPALPAALGLSAATGLALARDPVARPGDPLRRLTDRLAADRPGRPVLLVVDDLQWAAPDTVAALRELASRRLPAALLLARRSGAGEQPADRLFTVLADDGALRCTLPPLAEEAVAQLLADELGRPPSAGLLALGSAARGVPGRVLALARALRESGTPGTDRDPVRAPAAPWPRPVRRLVLEWLSGLSEGCRSLLDVAAVAGRSFSLSELTMVFRLSALDLLPVVQEAVAAGVLEGTGRDLRFAQEPVWRCLRDEIPLPVRSALLRDLGRALMGGGEYQAAAERLADAVRVGEARAVADLDRAAREVLKVAPHRAVDLVSGALAPAAGTPEHSRLQVITALGLAAQGRLARAADTARRALADQCDPGAVADLRYTLASVDLMTADPSPGSAAVADRAAPAWPGLSVRHGSGLAALWARCAYRPGDLADADHRAEALRVAGEPEAAAAGGLLRAVARWHDGLAIEALTELRSVQEEAGQHPATGYFWDARPQLATMLVQLRELDEAAAVIDELAKEIERADLPGWSPLVLAPRALLALAGGALDEAGAHADAVLDSAEGARVGGAVLLALSVRAEVALRLGDQDRLPGYVQQLRTLTRTVGCDAAVGPGLLTLLRIAEAGGGPAAVPRELAALGPDREATLRVVSLAGPAVPAWLARAARSARDQELAERVVDCARQAAERNPGLGALAEAAAHAAALLHGAAPQLCRAAAGHRDPWARAQAEEDLGLLLARPAHGGREVPREDRAAAARHLQEALAGYQEAGSAPDTARVRSVLRQLGVRRRHWTYADRPATGWESLTTTEQTVADLVATGLTNREAARRMFLSPHTVNHHLRQIFRKLGISSRVELARMRRDG
ncbi:LuxR C-terminal-related transcriptional regulator [Kitasatospora sp. NPDC006697]|uniref:helix-turn-helix transcriptional regulator n=1 Tax=Kitasatospora sp. NPDC006697 TaxID=3364020 RepID=UPI0036839B42